MSNILVTGATGHLGKAVVKYLLKKTDASNVKVLVRDTAKAADLAAQGVDVRVGDYGDKASLLKAFTGVDKLFLVSGNDLEHRGQQQKVAVEAAKEAGVKYIVYTSFQRANNGGKSPIAFIADSHIYTEESIKQSGLTYTLLLNSLYADVIPMFAGDQVLAQHAINYPAQNGKTGFATREDMAEASANLLLEETGKYNNQSVTITGAEAISWADIAAYVSEITGEKIDYNSPPVDAYRSALEGAQVPTEIVSILTGFGETIALGEFEEIGPALQQLLGRKPTSVKSFLTGVYGK